jgi:hypothetical protein
MSQSGSTNAEPKPTMLDDRMSEGTGLISNDFQVEVSLEGCRDFCGEADE